MWSFKNIKFSLFDKVKNYFKVLYFIYVTKPKQVKEALENHNEEEDIKNKIFDDFVALYKVSPSDLIRLANFNPSDNDEKTIFHNQELEKGRKHLKPIKSPLFYEPETTEQKIIYADDNARNISRAKLVDFQKVNKKFYDKDRTLVRVERLKMGKTNIK